MPPLQTPGTASMIPGTGGGGRFTGRMHAARHVCFAIPFFDCDGVWSMRRGGIDAARETVRGIARCRVGLVFALLCRAGS